MSKKEDKKAKKAEKRANKTTSIAAMEEIVELDIPDDEIWSYQIPGLAAPRIGKEFKHATIKKIIFIVVIVFSTICAIYFSLNSLSQKTFQYKELDDGTYQLYQFINSEEMTEVTFDKVVNVEYTDSGNDEAYTLVYDDTKTITEIREFALNCVSYVEVIHIGPDVKFVDSLSFYSCWNLKYIDVDDDNPYYCDVDGVLYSKDMTQLICFPCDYDEYLREKYGYVDENATIEEMQEFCERHEVDTSSLTTQEEYLNAVKTFYQDWHYYQWSEEEYQALSDELKQEYADYNRDCRTYVIPDTVTELCDLSFAYCNLYDVYFPEGLKKIDTQSFFKSYRITNLFSYTGDYVDAQTVPSGVYLSLPEGLEFIGSDAFSYNKDNGFNYIYIPSSVTQIDHHAFWENTTNDNTAGLLEINVALSEDEFKANCDTASSWIPKYGSNIKHKIPINYSAERADVSTAEDRSSAVKPDQS